MPRPIYHFPTPTATFIFNRYVGAFKISFVYRACDIFPVGVRIINIFYTIAVGEIRTLILFRYLWCMYIYVCYVPHGYRWIHRRSLPFVRI